MLFRLHALYLRYAASHADRLGGFSLPRVRGKQAGQVETVQRARGITRITGWTRLDEVRVDWPGGHAVAAPSINRPDVARHFDLPLETGFEIEVPESARPLTLTAAQPDGRSIELRVPHPSDPPTPAAHRRLRRAFARDLMRAAPSLLRWFVTRDPVERGRVKRILGLDTVHPGLPIDTRYLQPAEMRRAQKPFTIILPVHNAFDMVTECLSRVDRHTDLDWHMVLVEDASTDERVRPYLQQWAEAQGDRVTLITLDENHGFIGAVNRGFALAEARPGHIVLLNSDAMVPAEWASRLLAPLEVDPTIASVTPMSNDAEIFSVPVMGQNLSLPPGLADRLDEVAQTLSMPDRLPSAPTGVGFCMAMNSKWVAMAPRFDTAFGRGYGEEVDWCQKMRARGGKHIGLPSLFVEHRGGQSFGAEAKDALVFKANGMIARRYPSYDLDVQSFIGRDPLRTPRLALAIALAGARSPDALPLYIAHSMGGGADHALAAEIAARTEAGQFALVLRVGGAERWQVEVHGRTGVVAGTIGDLQVVQRMLDPVPSLRIIYSCGVGDGDPAGLPTAMMSLRRLGRPDVMEARVHDYFMVSPSYCLLNADGRYRGPVHANNTDAAHRAIGPGGRIVPLDEWQAAWHRFLFACSEITVFSEASRSLITATYHDLGEKIVCRPHHLNEPIARVAAPKTNGAPTLAVLGNLNHQKGAQVLCDLAQRGSAEGGPRLVLIGNMDTSFSLPSSVTLHGSYKRSEIPSLAERYGVGAWLVPSIWPETFSFVTHEALATGLPVFAFDIGAQGEALHRSATGHPIPFDPDADHAEAILAALRAFETKAGLPRHTPDYEAAE